jgi:hypothetical protein
MFRDRGSSAGPALFLHYEYLFSALRTITIPNRRPCNTRLDVAGPPFVFVLSASFDVKCQMSILAFVGLSSTVFSRRTTWSQDSLQTNKTCQGSTCPLTKCV